MMLVFGWRDGAGAIAICMPVKCGSLLRNLELLEIIPANFRANEPDAVTPPTTIQDTKLQPKCAPHKCV